MKSIFLAFLVVIFFFLVITSKGEENEKLVKISKQFLVEICKNLRISENPEDLVNCYKSSIYFRDYLWVIAYILEEKKSFKTQMILPKGVIDDKNCVEINLQQCITIVNFLINKSSISVEYNAINSMVSPPIEECNFENTNLLLSLNALWMDNSSKISDLTQGVIMGRGYQELIQFTSPFLDLSTRICQDVKMYLFTEKYKMKLKATIKNLIQYKNLSLTIPDPVYVRLPLKYDEELDLNWLYCQDLPKYLNKLDEKSNQIKLDLRGKSLIINKDIITKCTVKNNNKVMKIITWKIVN
ncbi:hypothetical protein CmeUKMEL1_00295 [Cryptosporidium meleagridis]|uniref:Integral membrane protein n=1 Tax=Cryptosporidium meleagridis TaxID=93969 RepID=A0A2P4YW45_9CRYT|nr:hypothetical protein CmeUKMEL1_00295 [Cryptosporidium meleagridis]